MSDRAPVQPGGGRKRNGFSITLVTLGATVIIGATAIMLLVVTAGA